MKSIDSFAGQLPLIGERRVWSVALCLLACGYALAFLLQRTIILADYPDWAYQGFVAHAKVFSPEEVSRFSFKSYPVPNSVVTIVIAALLLLLPPLAAAQMLVAVLLLLFPLVLRRAAAAMAPDEAAAKALFLFPVIAIATPFWWGSLSYQFALLFFVAYLRWDAVERLSRARLLLLSIAIFFSHAIVFIVFVAHVSLKGLLRRRSGDLAALLPAMALGCWYVVARFVFRQNAEQISLDTAFDPTVRNVLSYQLHTILKRGPFHNLVTPDGRSFLADLPWLFWAMFAMSGLYLMIAGVQLIHRLPARLQEAAFDRRFDLCFFLVIAIASLVVPIRFLGVADFGQRLMILAFLGLALRTPFSRGAARGLCLIAVVVSLPALIFLIQRPLPQPDALRPDGAKGASGQLTNRLLDAPVFARSDYYESIRRRDFGRSVFPSGILIESGAPDASSQTTGPGPAAQEDAGDAKR